MSNNKKTCKQIMEYSLDEYYSAIKNYHHEVYEAWGNACNFQPRKDTEAMFPARMHLLITA